MTRKGLGAILRPLPFLLLAGVIATAQPSAPIQRPTWDELAPIHSYLTGRAITAATLDRVLEQTHLEHAARVREGDLDHLVFYALQSTRFTQRPAIEPALSAKALVDGLEPGVRTDPVRNAVRKPSWTVSSPACALHS